MSRKILTVDIETTGIDIHRCAIIQIGAVIEDTSCAQSVDELPTFSVLVDPHAIARTHDRPDVLIESWPEENNADMILKARNTGMTLIDALSRLASFAERATHNHHTGYSICWAGANPIFDYMRIVHAFNMCGKYSTEYNKLHTIQVFLNRVNTRLIDPSAYFDTFDTPNPPGLQSCLRRAGIEKSVQHEAVSDCKDVITLLRVVLENYTSFYNP